MKKPLLLFSTVALFLSALFTSCDPPINKTSFMGEWFLSSVSGGASGKGSGYKKDFNLLYLKPVNGSNYEGKYSFINFKSEVEFGTFVIDFNLKSPETPTPRLSPPPSSGRITFKKDPSSGSVGLNSAIAKRIELIGNNQMKLSSFASDDFEFTFVRTGPR